jgi:hypothetical protein
MSRFCSRPARPEIGEAPPDLFHSEISAGARVQYVRTWREFNTEAVDAGLRAEVIMQQVFVLVFPDNLFRQKAAELDRRKRYPVSAIGLLILDFQRRMRIVIRRTDVLFNGCDYAASCHLQDNFLPKLARGSFGMGQNPRSVWPPGELLLKEVDIESVRRFLHDPCFVCILYGVCNSPAPVIETGEDIPRKKRQNVGF